MPVRSQSVALDDAVHAYRWILGREPESADIAQKAVESARDRDALRARLLASREFRRDFQERHALAAPVADWLAHDEARWVFVHLPKCGGSTLHELLAEAVGPARVSAERHNRLSAQPLGDLAAAKLFSGHYDARAIALLPWPNRRVVTMLREPRQRLISLYRYLRAHAEPVIERDHLALARAARETDLGPFLKAALTINPASVDNSYLRAFGAWLPFRRWEQRAEPAALLPLEALGPPDELLAAAIEFLAQCAAVGVMERFDVSMRAIFAAFGLAAPKTYEIRQRLDDLVVDSPASFAPVEAVTPTAADERLIERLTRYDRELYAWALARLAADGAATARAADPSGARERTAA